MKIEKYSFGTMVIEGKTYTADLIIYPDRVESNWRRLQGHLLQKQDLGGILACKPAVLVVGTGNMGVMKVPDLLREELSTLGIELILEKTGKAVDIYNQMQDREDVVAAFHLTC